MPVKPHDLLCVGESSRSYATRFRHWSERHDGYVICYHVCQPGDTSPVLEQKCTLGVAFAYSKMVGIVAHGVPRRRISPVEMVRPFRKQGGARLLKRLVFALNER